MGKKYLKCDICGKSGFKSKRGLTQHKNDCKGEKSGNETNYCLFCEKEINPKNKAHKYVCRERNFVKEFMGYLLFICKMIKAYNDNIDKINYVGDTFEQKLFLCNYLYEDRFKNMEMKKLKKLINDNFYENLNKINEIIEKRDYMRKKIIKNIDLRKYKMTINLEKNKQEYKYEKYLLEKYGDKNDLLKEIENKNIPKISCREILNQFLLLKKVKLYKKNKEYIFEKIKKNFSDYPTDLEIKKISSELYSKITEIRKYYNYEEKFYNFLNLLCYFDTQKINKFYCVYCNKYFKYLKKHTKNCFNFYKTVTKYTKRIKEEQFINKFYIMEESKINLILEKFKDKSFIYFLNNIDKFLYNKNFIFETETKKQKIKYKFKNLLKEINDIIEYDEGSEEEDEDSEDIKENKIEEKIEKEEEEEEEEVEEEEIELNEENMKKFFKSTIFAPKKKKLNNFKFITHL